MAKKVAESFTADVLMPYLKCGLDYINAASHV